MHAEPRFLVDSMMGRLLRWLRVLGVDTLLRDEHEGAGSLLERAHTLRRAPEAQQHRRHQHRRRGRGRTRRGLDVVLWPGDTLLRLLRGALPRGVT